MAGDDLTTAGESDWPVTNPWPMLGYGLAAGLLAITVSEVLRDNTWPLLRVFLIGTGLIAAGGAVSIRPRSFLVVLLAALTGLFAYLAMSYTDWDSAQLVVGILTTLAFLGALLNGVAYCLGLLFPGNVTKVVFSILFSGVILVHFGGILSAVTSVPPPNGPAPWISDQLWKRVYRPYLQFGHLNNAYHFYSPEPGPPIIIWSLIEYADGSKRWIWIPNRDEEYKDYLQFPDGSKQLIPNSDQIFHDKDPLKQEWYRRLSLTESTNQLQALPMIPQGILQNRILAGRTFPAGAIPLHPYLAESMQFRVPQFISLWMVPSYARHLARNYPHPLDPSIEFKSVKIYRVIHTMLEARQFNRPDLTPTSRVLYFPYYHGEFDKEGKMVKPEDPFLYWLIPIEPVYENPSVPDQPLRIPMMQEPAKLELKGYLDYLTLHSGANVSPWGEDQR